MRLFISAAALLFVLLTLTSFFSEAGATKHIPAKIKQLYVKSEVYENDLIHVQCVVDYHEPGLFDEILVEVHRSLFNSTENQVLSLNGEVLSQPPPNSKQSYDAYVAENGPTSREHAFKITNVHIKNDSGKYECLVKNKNGSVLDRKHVTVDVIMEEPLDYEDIFTINRASNIPSLLLGQTDDLQVAQENTLPSNLKCKTEREVKYNGNMYIRIKIFGLLYYILKLLKTNHS